MLKFGTLGAARITPEALIDPCRETGAASVVAVAARDRARAEAFAKTHGIAKVYESYEDVIADPEIDAIYNPLPISAHCEWTIKALAAGKPVLCEKSFASNTAEAQLMHEKAEATGLVLMDAFHYRYHPVFARAIEIYQSGVLGDNIDIDAVFQVAITDENDIRMRYDTAGGVTMDIGCYPLSWVRHLTGMEPTAVEAEAVVGPPDVDVALRSRLVFDNGVTATTSGDMQAGVETKALLRVTGDTGEMIVTNPIAPQYGHNIRVTVNGMSTDETLDRRATYSYQLDAFIAAVREGASIATDSADAVKQMALIDRCYEAAGLPLRGMP